MSKGVENQVRHRVSFEVAQYAFADPKRIIYKDLDHRTTEESRYSIVPAFCGRSVATCVIE